ncbi:MAG: hypothetical protein OXI83_04800 [Gemmatimonadota bacterium]|nr:hypothetical protein [Gemmatimonadota bacterium]
MIEGVVNVSHEAAVPLAPNGSVGQTRDSEAVITRLLPRKFDPNSPASAGVTVRNPVKPA